MIFRKGESKIDTYEIIAMVLGGFLLVNAVFKFLYFRFWIENDELIIKKGWLKKEKQVVPLERIQSVQIDQSLLHRWLNIVKISIDTAGSGKTEVTIEALYRSMAESLSARLSAEEKITEGEVKPAAVPLVQISGRDLLRLSLSANHFEALLLLLSFGLSIWENLREFRNEIIPSKDSIAPYSSLNTIAVGLIALFIITLFISTIRIILKYYQLTVQKTHGGFYIRSGLTSVRERIVSFPRIQFVSWRANWIRRKLNLWILEYRVAGGDESKNKMRVQVPVTRTSFLPLLAEPYHHVPEIEGFQSVTMHPYYIRRRVMISGVIPSVAGFLIAWPFWGFSAFFLFTWVFFIWLESSLTVKNFRLWAVQDIIFINKGAFGREKLMMHWYKIQTVEWRQTLSQKRKGLASISLYTAGGRVRIHYIKENVAWEVLNYGLYITEKESRNWM
jgi:putative membrane protein